MVEYSFYGTPGMHGSSSTPGAQATGTKNIIFPPPKAAAKIRSWTTLSPTSSWPTLLRMTAAAHAKFRPLAARVHAPCPLEHARGVQCRISAAVAHISPSATVSISATVAIQLPFGDGTENRAATTWRGERGVPTALPSGKSGINARSLPLGAAFQHDDRHGTFARGDAARHFHAGKITRPP